MKFDCFKMVVVVLMVLFPVCLQTPSVNAEQMLGNKRKFKEQNPDWKKYEFTRDYLTSLEYLKKNAERYEKIRTSSSEHKDEQRITVLRDELIQSNVNLRVARNYLKKYHNQTNNGLMLKVSDIFMKVCDTMIELNNQERALLEEMHSFQVKGSLEQFNLDLFESNQRKIYESRKESLRELLTASLLVGKVLVSNQENYYGEFDRLGITQEQRYKLLNKLKRFNQESYKGDLRIGLSFVEGSVVAIREVLENYNYETNDG
ncbi:MAG: hypothetical protein AB7S78_04185 [Candidatus Omnitrophota bacterium]